MLIKKNIPNIITIIRGILTIAIIILFLINSYKYGLIILILFLAASISDFLDGYFARKWNVVSSFGKTADPLLDAILNFSLLVLIFNLNIIPKIIIIILIILDLIVGFIRSTLLSKGKILSAIYPAKIKTAFLMITITLMLSLLAFPQIEILSILALGASLIAVTFSLISVFIYLKIFTKSLSNSK